MIDSKVQVCYYDECIKEKIDMLRDIDPYNIIYISYSSTNTIIGSVDTDCYNKFHDNYSHNEAVIIFSSGTTGNSKGIILSHYAINTNADAITSYMMLNKDDCFLIVKPLTHSSTLVGELLVALKTKTKMVISKTIVTPQCILDVIERQNITILCLNPTLLKIYCKQYIKRNKHLDCLKRIYISGAILTNQLCEFAHNVFKSIPIYNVYGLTEAGPRVSAQTFDYHSENSVGKPLPNVQVIIVDDNGKPLGNYQRGHVHVNTQSKFSGYAVGDCKEKSLYLNWLNTGDIGYFNNKGELFIVGRQDDLIILDSHKIYPLDIETLIKQHFINIECCIVGLSYYNREIIACYYVYKDEVSKQIRQFLLQTILPYEIPNVYVKGNSMPMNNNGKLMRNEIKNLVVNYLHESKMQAGIK